MLYYNCRGERPRERPRRHTSTNRLEKKLRKPLDKPTDLWYSKYSQEGKQNGMVAKWETDGPHG